MNVCRSVFSDVLRTGVFTIAVLLAFPAKVAFGEDTKLVGLDSECLYLIPSVENGGSELSTSEWSGIAAPSNLEEWRPGKLGIGFAPDHDPYYLVFLRHDVREEMRSINASLWARTEFEVTESNLATWKHLQLQMRFDDGFVAYLNGTEVARFNAPEMAAWNSLASAAMPDSQGSIPTLFDLDEHRALLVPGTNVLAIHLMNASSGSQDAVVLPDLFAGAAQIAENRHPRYMQVLALVRDDDPNMRRLVIGVERGRRYRLQASSNLNRWFDLGEAVLAEDTQLEFQITIYSEVNRYYYRVTELL